MKDRIEKYFAYKWVNDKNQAVSTEEDTKLIHQLPSQVQREIYSDFLFKDFLSNFAKFFDFPKDIYFMPSAKNRKELVKVQHACYNWEDVSY